MNIKTYILSFDNWFALGLAYLFAEEGFTAEILDPHTDKNCLPNVKDEYAVVIIDIQDTAIFKTLLCPKKLKNFLPVFVTHYDARESCDDFYYHNFIPKKIDCDNVFRWLNRYLRRGGVPKINLTIIERDVIYLLLAGLSPGEVAEQLDLSVKGVSCFKFSALRKLGLKRMNARCLFYIRDYLRWAIYLPAYSAQVESKNLLNHRLYKLPLIH